MENVIFEKKYGDGCVLSVREKNHPISEGPCVALEFGIGNGKGITAFLADVSGEEFVEEFAVALAEFIEARHANDVKDAITIEKGNE
jgi:hypothetical protein